MELHARTVTAPDGTVWRISPQWMARRGGLRLPSPWRRWYENRRARRDGRPEKAGTGDGGLGDACDCDCGDDLAGAIVVAIAVVLVGLLAYFLIWPLLALAVELLVVALLLFAGFVTRVVFRRPWIVEADASDGRRLEYRIVGYGPMRRCLTEVSDGLRYGSAAPPVRGAELVALPAPPG